MNLNTVLELDHSEREPWPSEDINACNATKLKLSLPTDACGLHGRESCKARLFLVVMAPPVTYLDGVKAGNEVGAVSSTLAKVGHHQHIQDVSKAQLSSYQLFTCRCRMPSDLALARHGINAPVVVTTRAPDHAEAAPSCQGF
ncbi:unnamed protein product [Protopolystoma xenopodis]|uniref:Uncharacterized protein n=1 Tax=Protopolystoma xenopodis TaxID=117903 RepID=A0A3S5AN61_9PLAT|nr:unnamed protein product [Protopolystoma xenopodis]